MMKLYTIFYIRFIIVEKRCYFNIVEMEKYKLWKIIRYYTPHK